MSDESARNGAPHRVAVATKHGKLEQIRPHFATLKDFELVLAPIDTDEFGTFSGEIERQKSPRETVIDKAIAGAKAIGADFGIASEGTIGPHPQIPFINADQELMAFVSISRGIQIVEAYTSTEIVAHTQTITDETNLEESLSKFDLPQHSVNIVIEGEAHKEVIKGLSDRGEILGILEKARVNPANTVKVESDFRAMSSPSRQANISRCAELLAFRLSSKCPSCSEFGWGKIGYEYGLACESCESMNDRVANAEKLGCLSCNHVELRSLGSSTLDPSRCEFCNP